MKSLSGTGLDQKQNPEGTTASREFGGDGLFMHLRPEFIERLLYQPVNVGVEFFIDEPVSQM